MSDGNGWEQYKVHVVHELERTNKRLTHIDKRLSAIENKLTILDTKVYIASFVCSIVFAGIFSFLLGRI
jgi:hypothetical protein